MLFSVANSTEARRVASVFLSGRTVLSSQVALRNHGYLADNSNIFFHKTSYVMLLEGEPHEINIFLTSHPRPPPQEGFKFGPYRADDNMASMYFMNVAFAIPNVFSVIFIDLEYLCFLDG